MYGVIKPEISHAGHCIARNRLASLLLFSTNQQSQGTSSFKIAQRGRPRRVGNLVHAESPTAMPGLGSHWCDRRSKKVHLMMAIFSLLGLETLMLRRFIRTCTSHPPLDLARKSLEKATEDKA
ncbi:hypothetical protein C1H46_009915 [Malus baccata]|uniref:Uncharacterized protein n=1 Tax=Malus baccata TaxID=106549 RepID=A0A540N0H7_MALBA|nr:hypothetical protein C1H46_009915 [Malus baccata]